MVVTRLVMAALPIGPMQHAAGASGAPPASGHSMIQCSRAWLLRSQVLAAAAAAAWPLRASAAGTAAGLGGAVVERAGSSGLSALLPGLPPEPIGLPRRRLTPAFAVLLLRSGYEAAESLRYIPMNDFQRDFWLLRRSEWEPYTLQYAPLQIKQGDLADPQYFDFISAMQLATISTTIPAGRQLFKEYCDVEEPGGKCIDGTKLVTRDPALQDNAVLPAAFERCTGDLILAGLRGGFQGVQFAAVPAPLSKGCTFEGLVRGVEALLAVFVANGFALNARVESSQAAGAGGGSFRVQIQGPATLWSLQSLASRRALVYPCYDAFTVAAFIRESGREASCMFDWSDTSVTETWRVL